MPPSLLLCGLLGQFTVGLLVLGEWVVAYCNEVFFGLPVASGALIDMAIGWPATGGTMLEVI